MSKRQKLSFFNLEGLPDEILLEIFSLLDIKGVLQCGQVSQRLRAIANDQSLWPKLNLFGRHVPYGFIEKAIQNGCEYLNLCFSSVHGGKKSEVPWKLKYLETSKFEGHWNLNISDGVLENCRFLQKLAVDNLILNSYEIEQICENGETLQALSLEGCKINLYHRTELIQKLFSKCPQLTELNIAEGLSASIFDNSILLDPHICALVDNLTPNILKLNLCSQKCVTDKHVNALVHRCNKITELDLSFTLITNDSMESIIRNLKSLEKLNLHSTKNIDFSSLLQLKSIPTLKILNYSDLWKEEDAENIKNLKLQLPHISINEEYLNIACPTKFGHWIWEIRSEQQDLFPETC